MSTLPPNVTAWVNTMLSSVVSISPDVVNVPVFAAPNVTTPPAVMSPFTPTVVVAVESISTVPLVPIALLIANVPTASKSTVVAVTIAPVCTIVPLLLIATVAAFAIVTVSPKVTLVCASRMFNTSRSIAW